MTKETTTNVHTYMQTEQKEPKAVMRKTKNRNVNETLKLIKTFKTYMNIFLMYFSFICICIYFQFSFISFVLKKIKNKVIIVLIIFGFVFF